MCENSVVSACCRRPAALVLLVLGCMACRVALAQAGHDAVERLRACLSLETETERIACFDRAVDGAADPSKPPSSSETPPLMDSSESAVRGRTAGNAGAEKDSGPERASGRAIVIVDVRVPRPGDARFLSESGHVYRQTGSAVHVIYPDVPFSAELTRGRLGGTFLRLVEGGPLVRVRTAD